MDASLDFRTSNSAARRQEQITSRAGARGRAIRDAFLHVGAVAIAVATLVHIRLLRFVFAGLSFQGDAMSTDLLYVAGIVLLVAITVFLAIACRRLQERK